MYVNCKIVTTCRTTAATTTGDIDGIIVATAGIVACTTIN